MSAVNQTAKGAIPVADNELITPADADRIAAELTAATQSRITYSTNEYINANANELIVYSDGDPRRLIQIQPGDQDAAKLRNIQSRGSGAWDVSDPNNCQWILTPTRPVDAGGALNADFEAIMIAARAGNQDRPFDATDRALIQAIAHAVLK
jgi:hypothetical protein